MHVTDRNHGGPSLADVNCCFKGCEKTVWLAANGNMTATESSATCTQCRRIVFCLDHFVELYRGHQRYSCPLCGSARMVDKPIRRRQTRIRTRRQPTKRDQINDETIIGQPPALSESPKSIPPAPHFDDPPPHRPTNGKRQPSPTYPADLVSLGQDWPHPNPMVPLASSVADPHGQSI